MNKSFFGSILLVVIAALLFTFTNFNQSELAQQQQDLESNFDRIEYARLIFDDEQVNWIFGDEQPLRPTTIRGLVERFDGRTRQANFAALLDIIGKNGWEFVMEIDDPEVPERSWLFMRRSR